MNTERLIHIKFEHSSALEAKRDILSSEIDLIKISRRLKKYLEYRMEELEIKANMNKKLRSFKLDIGRLQNLLPPVKIPEILKESHKTREEKEKKPEKLVKETSEPEDDLEMQLQAIQKRLGSIKG